MRVYCSSSICCGVITERNLNSVGVSPGKAAVMQICGETDHCHVLHIFHSGIPQSLRFLLEDPTLLKVSKYNISTL